MKKLLALSIFLLTAHSAATAQGRPSNIFTTTLANGLEVLVIEDNSVPLVTVEIAVHNGSFAEDPEYNGLSHLYEHMFFKANRDIPSQEKYLERVNELGIIFNGTTSTERVNYFFTLGSADVVDGLRFMNSAIRYPLFLTEEMKKENPVVDGEFQRAESSPYYKLFDGFERKMWGNLYSRKNVIGNHDIILTATPEKMRVIKDRYYYPNNSILVVAGDVQHDKIFAEARKLFGDWKRSDFEPLVKFPIPEFQPLSRTADTLDFVATHPDARVPLMVMGWHGPNTRTDVKSTLVADVFSYILDQKNSEFQRVLVDSGYALQVGLGYQTQRYAGPIQLSYVPNPARFTESFPALARQIDRFDDADYFTDEQLATAKAKLAHSERYGREKTSAWIHTVTFWWASAGLDYYWTYLDELNKVTRADIQAYVRRYIQGQPAVRGLLLNPQQQTEYKVTTVRGLF